ncbi:MAG: hypothetical protein QOH91_4590, partial [Mycobacterium sp.]|nr:hypothetical protein [Mycobacterium sp.]
LSSPSARPTPLSDMPGSAPTHATPPHPPKLPGSTTCSSTLRFDATATASAPFVLGNGGNAVGLIGNGGNAVGLIGKGGNSVNNGTPGTGGTAGLLLGNNGTNGVST